MRETSQSLEAILGDFKTVETGGTHGIKERECVTLWITPEDKARYDRLQEMTKGTGRRFSDIARKAFLTLLDLAEERAS